MSVALLSDINTATGVVSALPGYEADFYEAANGTVPGPVTAVGTNGVVAQHRYLLERIGKIYKVSGSIVCTDTTDEITFTVPRSANFAGVADFIDISSSDAIIFTGVATDNGSKKLGIGFDAGPTLIHYKFVYQGII